MTLPPSDPVYTLIAGAIGTGEIIEVRYLGGHAPGELRQIAPLSMDQATLRAKCMQSGLPKTFDLSKIRLPSDPAPTPTPPEPTYGGPADLLSAMGPSWERRGWHVTSDEKNVALHARFKHGKPRKTPELALQFVAEIEETQYDGDFNAIRTTRPHPRPWHVSGARTRLFASFQKAAQAFVEEELSLPPPA